MRDEAQIRYEGPLFEREALAPELAAVKAELAALSERLSREDYMLTSLKTWLLTALENNREHRGGSDASGHPHGWGVVAIPDWDVRQKLEAIDAAMNTKPEGREPA